jgi:sugar lactone lactonase YvrE
MKTQSSLSNLLRQLLACGALLALGNSARAQSLLISTLAGGGNGSADGTGSGASFSYPVGVAVDASGNVYVADTQNGTIRKVTPVGVVTTLAGSPGVQGSSDGTGPGASFNRPEGVAVDAAGNVYVADFLNDTIRKITPAGVVTTLAGSPGVQGSGDGTGPSARFNGPFGLAVDSSGNLYVGDMGNDTIRKVTPAGAVSTLAGSPGLSGSSDGAGQGASFNSPQGTAVDPAGNVYVADTLNQTIRMITPSGIVTTIAGSAGLSGSADGTGASARFYYPTGVAVDAAGDVFVADRDNCTIRGVTAKGVVATLAGSAYSYGFSDGTGAAARFGYEQGIAVDAAGNVYVADTNNSTIRKIAPGGVVTTLAGAAMVVGSSDGTGAAASFRYPGGIATDSAGNVYVADTYNNTVRKITPAGVVTTLAGTAGVSGGVDGTGAGASFSLPVGIVVNAAGTIYVSDFYDNTIRAITPAGVVTTLAGATGTVGSADGTGAAARFNGPQGIALDASGNLYVADSWNATIREVTPAGVVTTFAGTAGVTGAANGAATAATFSVPLDVAIDGSGDLYVADNGNSLIRKISAAGVVSSVIGTAGQNLFSAGLLPGSLQNPTSVALGGTSLFITTINGVAVVPNVP